MTTVVRQSWNLTDNDADELAAPTNAVGAVPLYTGSTDDDPALPALPHDQLRQMGEPVILNRVRQ